MSKTKFILNGEERSFYFENCDTLADALRNKVGLKSLKCGCNRGDCGSCTILIDNKSVRSCLILAKEVEGHEVTTLEGLMKDGPTDIQEALIKGNAFQCGFCAPGMIVSIEELYGKNDNPTTEDVNHAIAGNLCRCTGYSPITDALTNHLKRKGKS